MAVTRRDFLQIGAAAAAVAGPGGWSRVAAQQRLTEEDLLGPSGVFGNVTLIHFADLHAQLVPLFFREPTVNVGIGEARGRPPHVTGRAFLESYRIPAGSAAAHALTDQDFDALARTYGRVGGLDRVARVIAAIRAERPEALLLDGGDTWTNSFTSLHSKGQDVVDLTKRLKPHAMTGHWEFTLGAERVTELVEGLGFPFLAQNVRDTEFEDEVFKAREMFDRGGVKVAVIGQALPYTAIANPRWMFPKWSFGIRERELQRQVDEARAEGAGLVVLLSHNGFGVDRKLATRVRGIDVILVAHTHDALPEPVVVRDTLLIASGSHGKFVSCLDLDVRGGRVADFRFRLIPIFSDVIRPDAEMARAIQAARAPHAAMLAQEVARAEGTLFRRGTFNGTLDDVICDALLAERDAEIALSPGFRWGASVLAGPVTREDVHNATAMSYPQAYRLPFTGARLKEVLEDVADNSFNPDPYLQSGGDMVRVGGLTYAIDPERPMGRRITDMRLARTGEPIEAMRTYQVAGWASVAEGQEGPPIWEVVFAHLAKNPTIRPTQRNMVRLIGG